MIEISAQGVYRIITLFYFQNFILKVENRGEILFLLSLATLSIARRAMDPSEHLLHDCILFTPTTQQRELKSRHLFVPAALKLIKDLDKSNTTAAFWADHKWNMEWQKNTSRLHTFIPSAGPSPPGMTLPTPSWIRLNRL